MILNPILLEDVKYQWSGARGFGLFVPKFELKRGEKVLLLGASGSGKSTLLSLISGVIAPDAGRIYIEGQDLSLMKPAARDHFRGDHIGVIFQQFNLLPFASVADNILLPLRFAPQRRARVKDPASAMRALCAELALPEDLLVEPARHLSVGQQQRVAVARALIGSPPIIVADEPTSALDAQAQIAFLERLFAQAEMNKTTLLMVSHDERLGEEFDRMVLMDDLSEAAA